VVNTGNMDLDGMSVSDVLVIDDEWSLDLTDKLVDAGKGSDKLGAGESISSFTLEKGKHIIFTVSYTVSDTDTTVSNTAIAERGDDEEEDTPDDPRIDPNPKWAVEKKITNAGTGKDGQFKVGDTVEYTITVTNTGNVALTGLALSDLMEIDGKTILALEAPAEAKAFDLSKGETKAFVIAYTVQPTDKTLMNTAIVTDGKHTEEDPTDPEEIEDHPAWSVTKAVVNTGSGKDGAFRTGDTIKYEITVKNTGNVALTDLTVEDVFRVDGALKPLSLTPAADKFSIAKHGSVTFTSSYTIQAGDNVLVNTAKVGGEDDEIITEIEASPAFTVSKTVANTGSGKDGAFRAGDTVIYRIVVTNTGNTTLENLSLLDTFTVDGKATAIALQPDVSSFKIKEGETAEFTAKYTVGKTDLQLVNAVVVTGEEGEGEDKVVIDVEPKPEVTVKKEVINNGSGKNYQFMVGDKVRYRVTVTNVGNVDLEGLSVADHFRVNGVAKALELPEAAADFRLAKGETVTFDYSYLIKEGDERLVNTATVLDTSDEVTLRITDDPAAPAELPPAVGYTYNVGDCFD